MNTDTIFVLICCLIISAYSFYINRSVTTPDGLNHFLKWLTYLTGIVTYMWALYIVATIFLNFTK